MTLKIPSILAAVPVLALAAAFGMPAGAEETVDAKQKISRLRQTSRELSELARQPMPKDLAPEEERRADSYTRWLEETSVRLDELADRWAKQLEMAPAAATETKLALATKERQDMNQSFNLQYLQLQQEIQAENREFTMVSNVLKTRHDAAKNAINNLR